MKGKYKKLLENFLEVSNDSVTKIEYCLKCFINKLQLKYISFLSLPSHR